MVRIDTAMRELGSGTHWNLRLRTRLMARSLETSMGWQLLSGLIGAKSFGRSRPLLTAPFEHICVNIRRFMLRLICSFPRAKP